MTVVLRRLQVYIRAELKILPLLFGAAWFETGSPPFACHERRWEGSASREFVPYLQGHDYDRRKRPVLTLCTECE